MQKACLTVSFLDETNALLRDQRLAGRHKPVKRVQSLVSEAKNTPRR